MKIVNETGQEIFYGISSPGAGDCGTIPVDGFVDLPGYDNQPEVTVSVKPSSGDSFSISIPQTATGEQVEMLMVAE